MKESVLARLSRTQQLGQSSHAGGLLSAEQRTIGLPGQSPRLLEPFRLTLSHFVRAQQNYLRHITRVEPPFTWEWESPPPMEKLRESLERSGQGFLEIARDESWAPCQSRAYRRVTGSHGGTVGRHAPGHQPRTEHASRSAAC